MRSLQAAANSLQQRHRRQRSSRSSSSSSRRQEACAADEETEMETDAETHPRSAALLPLTPTEAQELMDIAVSHGLATQLST